MRREPLGFGVLKEHRAIEALTRIALRGVAHRRLGELTPGGANDFAIAVPDHEIETKIGGVHVCHLCVDALA